MTLTQEAAAELQMMLRAQMTESHYVPKSFVYVMTSHCECAIDDHWWIKVGRSIDPSRRAQELRSPSNSTTIPDCVVGFGLEYILPGSAMTERHLRNFLKQFMPVMDTFGEWLSIVGEENDWTPEGAKQELEDVLVNGLFAFWEPYWSYQDGRFGAPFVPHYVDNVLWSKDIEEKKPYLQLLRSEWPQPSVVQASCEKFDETECAADTA
jgi:hypothetical protein